METPICRYCYQDTKELGDIKLLSVCSCKGGIQYICLSCLLRRVQYTNSLICELCGQEYKLPLFYRLAVFLSDTGFGPNLLRQYSKRKLFYLLLLLLVLCLLVDITASQLGIKLRGDCKYGYIVFHDRNIIGIIFLYCLLSRTRQLRIKITRCLMIVAAYAVSCGFIFPLICELLNKYNIRLCLGITATYAYLVTETVLYNVCVQWRTTQLQD